MVIQSSNVSLNSDRNFSRNVKGETITTRWQASNPANMSSSAYSFSYGYSEESSYNNYNDFASNLRQVQQRTKDDYRNLTPSLDTIKKPSTYDFMEESLQKTLKSLLDMLYKAKGLTRDRTIDYNSDSTYYDVNASQSFTFRLTGSNFESAGFSNTSPSVWNKVTTTTFSYTESETTTFASTGKAITADGRQLDFDVSFTMSRAFTAEYSSSAFTQYEKVLTDPLVINLDSNPTSLNDMTFFFDIDCDGQAENISSLGEGSGFLAFDRNNDGIINDGSELFGTKSGNGFHDLSVYDDDDNGWIDEADAIYRHLKVWTKDENGNDKLIDLKAADVGAIYLKSTNTTHSLTDTSNQLNGIIRSTGIFLRESTGLAGTISQIDLATHQEV